MRVLYCALGIDITGTHGGATHAAEVAHGLAHLGHEVRLIGGGKVGHRAAHRLRVPVTLVPTPRAAAWLMTPTIRRVARAWQPDVIIERFYTFAGSGMLAAHTQRIPSVLEVNAPVTDPPGTVKDRIDRATGRVMTRWAEQQCAWADRIVTPLPTTVPRRFRSKVAALQWGANVETFDPARFGKHDQSVRALRERYRIPEGVPVVGFVGSFRAWHGAAHAVRSFGRVLDAMPSARMLLVGDGPERRAVIEQAAIINPDAFIFTGAIPHGDVPAHLALCAVAVAPFLPRLHAPLAHFGFYWSPLKVWEALAMALPVVTTDIPPLSEMIAGCGLAVPEDDATALARAMVHLLREPRLREELGANGRRRVTQCWSWQAHCRALDGIVRELAPGA